MINYRTKWILGWLFLFLATIVLRHTFLFLWLDNLVYQQAMYLSYHRAWLNFWYVVTIFGGGRFVYPVITLLGLVLLWRKKNTQALAFVLFFALLAVVPYLFKMGFAVNRPVTLAPFLIDETSWSFPSGHAFQAVLLFCFVPRFYAILFSSSAINKSSKKRWVFSFVMILGVGSICFSRVFLGLHWFSDVVAGVAWGGFMSVLLLALFERMGLREV
jgi:membrane-associated phospholipid phosphatase